MPDEKTPRPPRLQRPTERELESDRSRRERASSQVDDLSEEFDDPITGNYEGEELQRVRREKRTTGERLDRLEVKHDRLVEAVTQTRVAVGRIEGQLEVLPELVSVIKQGAAREHVTFTAKVDVDKAREEAKIEVEKAKELSAVEIEEAKKRAQVELDKAKERDVIRARSERRKRITKIVGAVVGMPALWEGIKWLAGKL